MLKKARLKVAAMLLTFSFTLLLYRLSCRTRTSQGQRSERPFEALLQQHEQQYLQYTANLTQQICQLKKKLHEHHEDREEKSHSELEEFMQDKMRQAESELGDQQQNEFAVMPFDSFTLHRVYQLETGLMGQPVETTSLRLDRNNEINGALEAALHLLNQPQAGDSRHRRAYSPKHFCEGIFRTEKDKGTLYDLAFRENSAPDFRRLVFFRPFAPLMTVREEFMDTSQILINIILPLAERLDAFRQFLQRFSEACVGQDGRTHLTVVLFGSKIEEVKVILDQMSRRTQYRNVTLIRVDEEFSRARGLDIGARAWKRSDVLLLFCDVDVHFTADFLSSCRMNTQPGKKVFYPVMFSQYNPEVIYGQHVPSAEDQLVIRKDSGYWKDSDFGMTCQYRSDFMNIGGFGASVTGSAPEDLHLYRKFLRSRLMVVRAPSRGLFHIWHQTRCQAHLSSETFKLCLQSKALNEASHGQLGRMIFHQNIHNHLLKYKQRDIKPRALPDGQER
ncbi:chondroitin sulfate N-acetylgalactosaminyltransferase 1 [Pseudorasbora parva]|uniref:chondroitin sulfate N-acetylgalactosaminyltransferase 1 n=1 Tax=Pseudorasbora parva TaxID=51549 RepID=UPI00351E12A6